MSLSTESTGELSHACVGNRRATTDDLSVDNGDEVKFHVEVCRIKNLPGLYLLSIKRIRGSVWSFKYIYKTVIE